MGIFAVTLNLGNTLVTTQHIARLTDAALLAGEGFGADALAEALRVQAGRLTGGQAVGVATVSGALQSYGVEREYG